MRPLLILFGLLLTLTVARADHVRVELIADRTAATPNATINVAVVLTIEPGWHVYWLNPGDTGAPPKMKWDLPSGVAASTLAYPVPERIDVGGGLTAFGYQSELTLLTNISISPELKDSVLLRGTLSCVVCSDECVLERHPVALLIPIGNGAANATGRFAEWRGRLPKTSAGVRLATLAPDGKTGSIDYALESGVEPIDFFPPPTNFATFDKPIVVTDGAKRVYRVPFHLFAEPRVGDRPSAIVVVRSASGKTTATEVSYAFRADDPAVHSN